MDNLELWQKKADILKALAHPSRLFVVDRLREAACSVGELAAEVGCDISTMSRHLSVLQNQSIVFSKKIGTTVNYHLNIPCVLNFFYCIDEVIDSGG